MTAWRWPRMGVDHDIKTYPDAGHAFLNDHDPSDAPVWLNPVSKLSRNGYHAPSAQDAQRRIVAFFDRPSRAGDRVSPAARARPTDNDPMGIEVRRITAREWREYRRLRLEALKDSPLAFIEQYDESLAQPDDFWRHRVRRAATDPGSAMFVALDGGRLVGKVGCFIESEITTQVSAHIVGVYVSPAYRGQAVAEALMTAAVEWARREHGSERVRLFVMDTNDRAAAFYRRLGFVPTGGTMPYPPDPAYTEQEMVLRQS